jgi:hypothetical protein
MTKEKEYTKNEDDIEPLKSFYNKLFSKEKLTKGELIQVIIMLFIVVIIIYAANTTTCELDCTMCKETTQTLIQKGWK